MKGVETSKRASHPLAANSANDPTSLLTYQAAAVAIADLKESDAQKVADDITSTAAKRWR